MTDSIVTARVASLMPDWDAAGIRDVEYLSGGYSNSNYAFVYDGSRYVIRIPQMAQPYVDRHEERAWYTTLPPEIGVRPLAFDVASGAMLSPWVEGTLLIDAWDDLGVVELADFLRGLHAKLPRCERRYDIATLSRAYWHPDPPPHAVEATPAARAGTCHNDLNPWNVVVTPTGWVTLDWEFVGVNDPLFDVVSLYLGLALPAEGLPDIAALYLGESTERLTTRVDTAARAFWVRELGWAQFQMNAGNRRAEILAQADTARAALEVLARAN